MRISSVSNNNNVFSPLNNNNTIKLLEKQKTRLQEQIKKTNESKLDDKTKQDRIKQLQEQIQQIDMQIQQKQTEKLNKYKNTKQKTTNAQSNENINECSNDLSDMSSLVQVSCTYSKVKIMKGVKNNLNGKGRILKKEIETDESRSGHRATSKRKELQKIESREQMLDKKVSEATKTVQEQIKEASKEESKNDDTEKNNVDVKDVRLVNRYNRETIQQLEKKEINKNYTRIDIRI